MAFDIYPNPLAPLKVPKNSSSSLIAITQRTGPDNVAEPGTTVTSHPTTMFIRVALLSPLVDPTKPPTIILKINTGDETEITGGYAPPTTIPDNGATGDAADGIRHDPDANRIFLIKVLVYGAGLTWQMRIKNNDVSVDNSADHEFVWVIGDSLSESRQPWIDAPAATVQVDALTGQSPAPRLTVTIPNKGTGPLTITDLVGANAGDPAFKLAVVPAGPIDPNGTGDVKIDFIAPAVIGDKNANYDIGSSDPNGLTGAAQSHNKRIPLHGVARQLEIALLVDASGSMGYTPKGPPETVVAESDARWGKLKEAAKQFLDLLGTLNNGEGRFGIAVFPDFTAATYPASQAVCPSAGDIFTMQDINTTNIGNAQHSLDDPPPAGTPRKAEQDKGATPIGFGIGHTMGTTAGSFGFFQGAEPAKSTNKRFLVLMTDGAQNCDFGPDVFYGTGNTSFQGKNIKVITVGYGTGDKKTGFQVDPDLLKEIANQSLGTYLDSGADNAGLNLKKDFRTAITTGLSLDPTTDPTGILTPNAPEVRQQIIITPYDSKAAFVVSWKTFDANRVDVSILTPLCELITEATASKDPSITFSSHPTYVVFGFNHDYLRNASEPGSPRYGTWRLIITGNFSQIGIAAAAVQDSEPYDYEVITESRLKLSLSADHPEFFAGDTINLTATITLDGKGVPNATTTVSLSAPGIPSDNFLAENKITAAEFSRTREQFANADVTATGIKIFALQQKDVLFVDLPRTIQFPMQDKGNGRYTAAFGSTSVPGNYEFYVTAIGQTEDGVSFRREKRLKLFIGVRPDPKFTLLETVFRTQIEGNQTIRFADVKVTLLDQFRNVKLVSDPDHDSSIQLTTTAGKFTGGLVWNLDGSYSQTVTYPAGVTPAIGLNVGGEPVIVPRPLPSFDRLRYVDRVVDFRVGGEAAPGANKHRDPNAILGDPTLKAPDVFLAAGGLGNVTVAIDRQLMIAGQGDDDITVFVHPSDEPRPYAVDVLPITLPIPIFIPGLFHWVTLGTSPGVTQSFSLRQVGIKLCMAVRIRDLSRRTRNGLFQPDEAPGACFSGVGAKNTVNYPGGANDLLQLIKRIIELLLQKHDG